MVRDLGPNLGAEYAIIALGNNKGAFSCPNPSSEDHRKFIK